jgi:MoaA/NifB/PqqE/SkfB family radical SAM enzyme
MSIQTLAKQLKIDKLPFIVSIYRDIQDYWTTNHNREVVIDICTICKSNCVYCLHQKNKLVKPQLIDFSLFKRLVYVLRTDKIKKIHLFQSGEPLLHPQIYDMIKLLSELGINCTIGTRLNAKIDISKLEHIIAYAGSIIEFLITIDTIARMNEISSGMNKKLVIYNIQQLSKLLKYKNVRFTFVSVVSKVNENDIEEVKRFVNSYGFTNWYAESMGYYMWHLASKVDLENISKFITSNAKYKSRFDMKDGKAIETNRHCNGQIPTINPDGDVSICCHDMLHTINAGNILEVGSLNKIIKSDKYKNLKALGVKKQLEICKSCN